MALDGGRGQQEWQKPENVNLREPHNMTWDARWQLYFHWLGRYRNLLKTELESLGEQYRVVSKQYAEIRDIVDVNLMKHMLVVSVSN